VSFEAGAKLALKGKVDLSEAPFLKLGTGPVRAIGPTTTETESPEELDFDDEEWDEWEEEDDIPVAARIYQNFPNPFNPTTTISFRLRAPSVVSLKIYGLLGQEVATVLDREEMDEGYQTVEFSGSGFASGVYFYHVDVQSIEEEPAVIRETKKMLLIK
jgi:hypothetical protein